MLHHYKKYGQDILLHISRSNRISSLGAKSSLKLEVSLRNLAMIFKMAMKRRDTSMEPDLASCSFTLPSLSFYQYGESLLIKYQIML